MWITIPITTASQSDASLSEVSVCLFVWSRVHKGDKETGLRVYNLTGVNNDNAPLMPNDKLRQYDQCVKHLLMRHLATLPAVTCCHTQTIWHSFMLKCWRWTGAILESCSNCWQDKMTFFCHILHMIYSIVPILRGFVNQFVYGHSVSHRSPHVLCLWP